MTMHNPLWTTTKGQTVITCSCGWIGVRVNSVDAAREQHRMHVEQARGYDLSPKLEPVPWS